MAHKRIKMVYKIMAEKNGEFIEWGESDPGICVGEFVVTKLGPKKVVMVGMLECDTTTGKSYIPIWTK